MTSRALRTSNVLNTRGKRQTVINDENKIQLKNAGKGPPATKIGSKRNAESLLDDTKNMKKRSTFGDITNAILERTIKDTKKVKKINTATTKSSITSQNVLKPVAKAPKKKESLNKNISSKKENISTKSAKSETLPSDDLIDASFCSSLPSSQGLQPLSSGKLGLDETNYITASEGSPVRKLTRRSAGRKSLVIDPVEEEEEDEDPIPSDVEDYDGDCKNDLFAVATYAMDIFRYYREREKNFIIEKYMTRQPEISKTMRAILVDWMVEVQESFELNHETLYLAVKLVDYYLTKVSIKRDKLQLVGSTSLFIACKFDERLPPYADDFLFICDNAYKKDEFLSMEIKMLKTIGYDLGIPLSYRFLRRYARCSKLSLEDLTLARYILERSLMEYDLIDVSDSALAAAALLLSRAIKKEPQWTKSLEYYSGYKLEEIFDLVHRLHNMLLNSPNDKQKTIKNKYSHKIFFQVATIPVPEDLGL